MIAASPHLARPETLVPNGARYPWIIVGSREPVGGALLQAQAHPHLILGVAGVATVFFRLNQHLRARHDLRAEITESDLAPGSRECDQEDQHTSASIEHV